MCSDRTKSGLGEKKLFQMKKFRDMFLLLICWTSVELANAITGGKKEEILFDY